jgi:hypothetical protein
VPSASPEVTSRVAQRVLAAARWRSQTARRVVLLAAVFLVVGGTGFGAGRWTSPSKTAADITIGVRPDTISVKTPPTPITLFGTVASGRPGESVQIEANECGRSGFFHELIGVRTEAQGVWSLPIPGPYTNLSSLIDTSTKYRARWNGHVSDTVTLHVRSEISSFFQFPPPKKQKKKPGKRYFAISVGGRELKYRPRVVVERRVGNRWKTVARPVVKSYEVTFLWLPAARGQVLRVRLPDSQAAPCYLGSVSDPLRVR